METVRLHVFSVSDNIEQRNIIGARLKQAVDYKPAGGRSVEEVSAVRGRNRL